MTTFLSRICIAGAAAGLIAIMSAVPAGAQPFGPGWGPGGMMGPGMMGPGPRGAGACNPRTAGLAAWRIDLVERSIQPTDAQRPLLDALKTASTQAAQTIAAACPRILASTPPERLEAMEKRLEAMLQAVKTVRPAFDAFYASLNEEQKSRLDALSPGHWGSRMWRWRQSER